MQHIITIIIDRRGYDWQIVAAANGRPARIDKDCLIFETEFFDMNRIEIVFDGKDPLISPDMTAVIQSMIIDYIDVSPSLYLGTHHTTHPDWREICPCTDINLNGTWVLEFSASIMRENLEKFLGLDA